MLGILDPWLMLSIAGVGSLGSGLVGVGILTAILTGAFTVTFTGAGVGLAGAAFAGALLTTLAGTVGTAATTLGRTGSDFGRPWLFSGPIGPVRAGFGLAT